MLSPMTEKQLTVGAENKLPSKEERQKAKKEQDQINKDIVQLKAIVEEFVKEKVLPLDIRTDLVDQIPELVKSLISIYKTNSQEWADFLKARTAISEVKFKDLTDVKKDN